MYTSRSAPSSSINDRELTPDEIFDFQQRDQQFIEPEDNTLSLNSGFDGEGYARVESIDDLFGQEVFLSVSGQLEGEALALVTGLGIRFGLGIFLMILLDSS